MVNESSNVDKKFINRASFRVAVLPTMKKWYYCNFVILYYKKKKKIIEGGIETGETCKSGRISKLLDSKFKEPVIKEKNQKLVKIFFVIKDFCVTL